MKHVQWKSVLKVVAVSVATDNSLSKYSIAKILLYEEYFCLLNNVKILYMYTESPKDQMMRVLRPIFAVLIAVVIATLIALVVAK